MYSNFVQSKYYWYESDTFVTSISPEIIKESFQWKNIYSCKSCVKGRFVRDTTRNYFQQRVKRKLTELQRQSRLAGRPWRVYEKSA